LNFQKKEPDLVKNGKMEFCLRRLEEYLPAPAVEQILKFELTARKFETKRKHELCEHITVWNKNAVRREIEHSSYPLLERFRIPWEFGNMHFPTLAA
jgi:hypothetical protein